MNRFGMRPDRFAAGAAALILLASIGGCAGPQEPATTLRSPLVVGIVSDLPGFSLGVPDSAGFDVDLMNAIGTGLGLKTAPLVIKTADRDRVLLETRAIIVVSAYSITPDRNTLGIDFAGPYMKSPQALLVRSAEAGSFTTEASVASKNICSTAGTTGAAVSIPAANKSAPQDGLSGCVGLLDHHQTDAVFDDALVLYGYVHAYPGKYQVVLPKVWGEMQYYGVGILGGHHADCERLAKVIDGYLQTQWRTDFQATLPDAAQAVNGAHDFESEYKPSGTDKVGRACKDDVHPPATR